MNDVLQKIRQARIDKRLLRANASRIPHDFKVGEQVFLRWLHESKNKAKPAWKGPFPITRVHANNTVTVELRPGVTDRVSIRRITLRR